VILHVLYTERDKTLHGCLTLLADPARAIEATLTLMLTAAHDPEPTLGWRNGAGQPTPTHPAVAGAARALLNKSDNERSSVVSSAVKFLNLYRDPIVVRNTETSDFAVRDLMHADAPVSLYLTIPPADIHRTRPLLRLLLHQIVSRLTESMDVAEGRTVARYRHPLLLMLDEFPTLGRMDVLQTALAYLPGYGIRAYLIVQDLTQLAHAYGRCESIISNCHAHARHGQRAGDQPTAAHPGRSHAAARGRGAHLRRGAAGDPRPEDPLLQRSGLQRASEDSAARGVGSNPPRLVRLDLTATGPRGIPARECHSRLRTPASRGDSRPRPDPRG
jgi:type IV secretory pathway TraG/TraD family ATPase VirD4